MGIFSGIKNSAVSSAAEKFISGYLERYGELQELKIDPEAKKISFKFLPKGENTPASVSLDGYSIEEIGSEYFFKAEKAYSNREWLTRLLEDFLVKKSVQVPNQYYSYIKLLL